MSRSRGSVGGDLVGLGVLLGAAVLSACRDRPSSVVPTFDSGAVPSLARQPGSPVAVSSAQPASERVPPTPSAEASGAGPGPANAEGVPASSEGWPHFTLPPASDFCIERVHSLDQDACFALPELRSSTLLVYLHGIVPPAKQSVQKTNLENVVANAAERAGVVALLPRGQQGYAPKAFPGWWGWPTSKYSFERHGAEFIAKIREKREQLEHLLQAHFERVFLAGSSSGAYFVAAILLHGAMPELSGYGVLSGGVGYATEGFGDVSHKPVYIGFGSRDSVAHGARALGERLVRAGWPVAIRPHAVPHGAREVYLDEAFAFWENPE